MKLVYKCDFCKYMGAAKDVEAHEKECVYNPEIKNCMTCSHCQDTYGISRCLLDNAVWTDGNCSAYKFGKPIRVIAV